MLSDPARQRRAVTSSSVATDGAIRIDKTTRPGIRHGENAPRMRS
jgi:hypothetical protein